MNIRDIFYSGNLTPENLKVTPITARDRKGNEVKKRGMPDVLPVIMGMDLEYRSYQYSEADQMRIMYGSALIPFITASGEIMKKYTKEYVSVAQIAVGEALGIDMAKLENDGVDGFQLDINDPKITDQVPEKVYAALEAAYPLGPITPEFLDANTACAEEHLGEAWYKGDNYRAYICYLIIKGVGQFAATCQGIVAEQVVGPLWQVLQIREQEKQVAAAMGKSAPGMTDLLGGKLSSEKLGKIVGLDGKEIKADDIVN